MNDVDYVSLQAIREDAGIQHQKIGESLTGAADGVNKVFLTSKKPIVDQDNDDVVSPSDIIVYVNNVPAAVQSINSNAGAITMVSAPANASVVSADYAFSPVSDSNIEAYRSKAQSWLNRRVKNFYKISLIQSEDDVPPEWQNMALLYAAGLILIKDYGSSADTDGSSKDGYKKLDLARSLMKDYIMDLSEDNDVSTISPELPTTYSDGEIFKRDQDLTDESQFTQDDEFMRHSNAGR